MGSGLSRQQALLIISAIVLWVVSCIPPNRDAVFVGHAGNKNQYSSQVESSFSIKLANESGYEFYLSPYLLSFWLEVRQLNPDELAKIVPSNIVVTFNNRNMDMVQISEKDTGWLNNEYFAHLEFKIQTIESDFVDSARLQFQFDSVFIINDSFLTFGPVSAFDQLYVR